MLNRIGRVSDGAVAENTATGWQASGARRATVRPTETVAVSERRMHDQRRAVVAICVGVTDASASASANRLAIEADVDPRVERRVCVGQSRANHKQWRCEHEKHRLY